MYIQSNDINGIVHSVEGRVRYTNTLNSAATLFLKISVRIHLPNLNVKPKGAIIFISNNVVVFQPLGTQKRDGNSIVGTFTRNSRSVSGALHLCLQVHRKSSVSGAVISNNNNNFSNITVSGTATIAGWVNTDEMVAGTKTHPGKYL